MSNKTFLYVLSNGEAFSDDEHIADNYEKFQKMIDEYCVGHLKE